MDNKDYKEPGRDYCSPEAGNPYERPLYETAEEYNQARQEQEAQNQQNGGQYAYNQFENNYNNSNNYSNYNNNYYGNGGYTNMGGVIIDSNGKEVKNRFGVQLTFSILEMLCCCASCITLIMGIIACVFTCQANTAYKESRYDDFKSKSKTSTILLIVGGVFAAISILVNAFSIGSTWDVFWDAFEQELENELGYDVDMDTFWEDFDSYYDDYDYDYNYDDYYDGDYFSEYNENADHVNFDDFNQIIVDGVTISLPCTYADLEAAGFFMNQTDLNTEIAADETACFELHTMEKTYIADVQFVNMGETDAKVRDCMVIYLDFYYESVEENAIFDGYEFVNGLTVFLTVDETLTLLGEPNDIYKEETDWGYLECYTWEFEYVDGYDSYVAIDFYDGVMYDVQINNGPLGY